MSSTQAQRIEKSDIKKLKPSQRDHLKTPAEKKLRFEKLKKAMVIGNNYKSKCTIVFEATDGVKHVESTIWMADEMYIVLKGGIVLPIACIRDVIV